MLRVPLYSKICMYPVASKFPVKYSAISRRMCGRFIICPETQKQITDMLE